MELKRMMEKLGQAKTHLELKKMIAEVDTNDSGTEHVAICGPHSDGLFNSFGPIRNSSKKQKPCTNV